MKCLVTGGLGFVGSNLVDFLVNEHKCDVTVIDNLASDSSSRSYMREDVRYWIDDIRNLNVFKYSHEKFDVIFHLAALARIQPSFKDPLTYLSVDSFGTAAVCEFARNCDAKIVYAGSSSAYAGHMLNPYAFAKYTGEQICQLYSEVYGVSTVTARFFNVYGNRQPLVGAYATVVGIFENQTKKGIPLTVTGDGTQRRDFTHVSDIIAGLFSLSQGNHKGEVYNLGRGKNISIFDLAKLFSDNVIFIPPRPGEAKTTLADYSKTTEICGWIPQKDIEDYVSSWKKDNLL